MRSCTCVIAWKSNRGLLMGLVKVRIRNYVMSPAINADLKVKKKKSSGEESRAEMASTLLKVARHLWRNPARAARVSVC